MANKGNNIPYLVEGALFAALATIFGIMGIYIPPLSLITDLLWTIPIIVVCIRCNIKTATSTLIVSFILMAIFSSPLSALSLILRFGIMSLAYGYSFRHSFSIGKTLLWGSIAATVGTILVFFFSIFILGFNLADLQREITMSSERVFSMYKEMGVLDRLNEQGFSEGTIKQNVHFITTFMMGIIPGVMVVGALFTAVCSFMVSRLVLKKMRFTLVDIPAFSTWKLPWQAIWGFNLALLFYLLGDAQDVEIMKLLGLNVLVIYLPVFFLVGLSVFKFIFQNRMKSAFFKFLLIFLIIIYFPFLFILLTFLGLFDTVFDYRKLTKDKDNNKIT